MSASRRETIILAVLYYFILFPSYFWGSSRRGSTLDGRNRRHALSQDWDLIVRTGAKFPPMSWFRRVWSYPRSNPGQLPAGSYSLSGFQHPSQGKLSLSFIITPAFDWLSIRIIAWMYHHCLLVLLIVLYCMLFGQCEGVNFVFGGCNEEYRSRLHTMECPLGCAGDVLHRNAIPLWVATWTGRRFPLLFFRRV